MFEVTCTRIPVMRLLASNASSAVVTWSRPMVSERKLSPRSARHFTGRFSIRAA